MVVKILNTLVPRRTGEVSSELESENDCEWLAGKQYSVSQSVPSNR